MGRRKGYLRARGIQKEKENSELLQTPAEIFCHEFLENKAAVIGMILFLMIFGSVIIVPFFWPVDTSYQEVSQQNVSPGLNIMNLPEEMKHDPGMIAVGPTYGVGVSKEGTVFIWGKYRNSLCEIPDGCRNVSQISAGTDHILALTDEGELYAWGSNRFGQIKIPDEVKAEEITQILAGNQISIVVTNQGTVYFWGNHNLMELDMAQVQGQVSKVAANSNTVLALLEDGMVVCISKKQTALSTIPEGISEVEDLALTATTAAVVKADGTILTWGSTGIQDNDVPQFEGRAVQIQAGRKHFTVRTNEGTVVSWGSDLMNQTDIPSQVKRQKIVSIFCGAYQNYAIDQDGEVYKWGWKGYLLGTDAYGRDLLQRLLQGGRMTMTIGLSAVFIQTILGVLVGGVAGYYGGIVDNLLMRLAEVIHSLPFLPFAVVLSAVIGNRLTQMQRIGMIMVILGLLSWPATARLVRAQVMEEREREFVLAAKAVGVKESKIIRRHILPNVIPYVIVSVTLSFASCMLTESALSFLGFGVVEPDPTWGNMLMGAQSSVVIGTYWWRWVFPALALSISTISINLIGDGLRDAMDPKLRRKRG